MVSHVQPSPTGCLSEIPAGLQGTVVSGQGHPVHCGHTLHLGRIRDWQNVSHELILLDLKNGATFVVESPELGWTVCEVITSIDRRLLINISIAANFMI